MVHIVWIAVAALIGGIVAAVLGWLGSQEAFDGRNFGASTVRALLAAVGFAVAYNYANYLTPIDFAMAFLGGAGVDVLGNRVAASISARKGK